MLAASTRLGPYEILAPLGAGGMGEVYRARDTRLGREVAVKVLPESLAGNLDRQARFEREAKAVAALSHPNILAIHDYGTEGPVTYAVMELLEGETLRDRLAKGPLTWREAVDIGAAIAEGLAAAHAKGIVHRDLKPENLFLTNDGRAKILDFGLARITPLAKSQSETGPYISAETDPGRVMGTVGYMSPEQVRSQPADARSDIFSFGCVLYEMMTGMRAFQRETAAETMTAILHDEPPEPTKSGQQVPPEVGRVLRQCLAKTPNQRLQSARDLALGLRATASDPALHLAPPARRPSRLIAGIVAGSLLLLVAAGGVFFLASRSGRHNSGEPGNPVQGIDSLAVLPFVNVGADASTEYLSDGGTMSLIDTLAQLDPDGLRVLSWTAVSRYKGHDTDPMVVAAELNVQAILIGQVTRRGEDLSIRVELVDTRDNRNLWGKSYSQKMVDLQTVHEEITREIAKKLRPRLTAEQMVKVAKRYPVNPEAYELYLKGRHIWSTSFHEERLQKAIDFFQQAIAKEPGYALAYAGLADAYHRLGGLEHLPPADVFPKGKEAAQAALKRDEALADAHASLGFILFEYEWAWEKAEKELRRALELNPNHANAHHWLSHFCTAQGRTEQSLEASRRYRQLEPLDITANAHLAWHYYFAQDYGHAIEAAREALVLDPNAVYPRNELVRSYEQSGSFDLAIEEGERALPLSKDSTRLIAALARAYAKAGQKDKAGQVLAELLAKAKKKYVSAYGISTIYLGLGDKGQALHWLEKACDEHSTALVYVKADPVFAGLHAEPRFIAILRRIGLADKVTEGDQGIHSVAVLPFENVGGDPKSEFLSDGVADQIINSLSQVRRKDLKVRPFTSVSQYRKQKPDVPTMARELNVQMIVTGTLRQQEDDLSISVAMVDARDDSHVWGHRYQGKLNGILDLQDQIAREVAENLRLQLSGEDDKRLTKRYTDDSEAYLLYREGMYHTYKFTPEGLQTGIEYFQRARIRDANYALAYVGLARCYTLLGTLHRGPREMFREARKHLAVAQKIDETLPEVHAGLGVLYLFGDWNWSAAERELKQAIALDPNVLLTRNMYGFYLAAMGRLREALTSIRTGKEIDPLAAARTNELAMCYNWMGQYDQAIVEARKAVEMDPSFFLAYGELGLAYAQKHMYEEASAELRKVPKAQASHPFLRGLLGYTYASAGQRGEAQKILEDLKGPNLRFGCAFGIARIHAALGEKEQAFEWLRKACDERDPKVIWIKIDPTLEDLRSDPRFAQVLREMGLPP